MASELTLFEHETLELIEWWLKIKKRWKLGLYVFIFISLIGTIVSLSSGITYQAKYSIYCKNSEKNYMSVTEKQFATSYNIVRFLGVRKEDLKVGLINKNFNVLDFSYTNKDRDKALDICNKWLHKYLLMSTRTNIENKDSIKIVTKPYVVRVDNRLRNIIVGMLFGLSAGVGITLFLDYLKKE